MLERELGPRCSSLTTGVRLTPAGQRFQRHAGTLVQAWDSARRAVALPPGREELVTVGAELSLWSPLLRHWLQWMRRECAELAVGATIDTAARLIEQVQDGSLDLASSTAPATSG